MKIIGVTAALAVAATCAVGVADAQTGDTPASAKPAAATAPAADPVPDLMKDPAAVQRGKSLFAGTCGAYCHKMQPGPGDAPYLFDCDWLHGGSDQEIFHTITHGVPGTRMVPFGGAIPDADIWRVIAYLKSASQCRK
jgi:mono/diheme cytochrome c family protein